MSAWFPGREGTVSSSVEPDNSLGLTTEVLECLAERGLFSKIDRSLGVMLEPYEGARFRGDALIALRDILLAESTKLVEVDPIALNQTVLSLVEWALLAEIAIRSEGFVTVDV